MNDRDGNQFLPGLGENGIRVLPRNAVLNVRLSSGAVPHLGLAANEGRESNVFLLVTMNAPVPEPVPTDKLDRRLLELRWVGML